MNSLTTQSEHAIESRQATFTAGCLNQWTRLRLLISGEGIWFWPTDITNQGTGYRTVKGYIYTPDFATSIDCCDPRWNKLGLKSGATVDFWPLSRLGSNFVLGYVTMTGYDSVRCQPLPTAPKVAGCWDSDLGRMHLNQPGDGYNVTGTYEYTLYQYPGETIKGEIFGSFWVNRLMGQFREKLSSTGANYSNGLFSLNFEGNSFTGQKASGHWSGKRC